VRTCTRANRAWQITAQRMITFVVNEAMKMEMTLRAPRSGKVETICVTAGEQLQKGDLIATIGDNDD
jgi:pyruvate carboxylase